MKKIHLLFCTLFIIGVLDLSAQHAPKREFRGAWIQCVNGQFSGMGTIKMKATLTHQLDELKKAGINAILFQVRPEADALYASKLEPWSRFLTDKQGKAPTPYWDPLQWMVEQCHQRGMELHAWINPYRAKTKGTKELAANHPYRRHPERFFTYDGLLLFDPGIPENRSYICSVVTDILRRYDVDGVHMDDYFYPYPSPGHKIPDDATYRTYGNGMNREDWRRENVNLFIKQMRDSIRAVKPWVKYGVSPFGIYRNKKSDPVVGSATRGLQNYDDLYADVLKWVKEGWVDYNIPQVYWEIGHPSADYDVLVRWWSEHAGERPLFIGQDVDRTVGKADPQNPNTHQMARKMHLQRTLPGIHGSCQWYAKAVVDNKGNYATALRQNYHRYPALQPVMPWIDYKAPKKVKKLKAVWTSDGYILFWTPARSRKEMDRAIQYVVYRFEKGAKVNLEYAENIIAITNEPFYKLPYEDGSERYTYVVTALDRLHNESKPSKIKVKL
ncbi:MAG: family 10 glycosylhydrolase [Paraprevotella sp.]|nr:family 10 glycosylhydrolase [Paraprevotella sp.]